MGKNYLSALPALDLALIQIKNLELIIRRIGTISIFRERVMGSLALILMILDLLNWIKNLNEWNNKIIIYLFYI